MSELQKLRELYEATKLLKESKDELRIALNDPVFSHIRVALCVIFMAIDNIEKE